IEALNNCIASETYFALIKNPAPPKTLGLSIKELRAWTFSQLDDFNEAFKLREETRKAYELEHDIIGLANNRLYTADDYRRKISRSLYDTEVDITLSAVARKEKIQKALTEQNLLDDLQRAEDLYRSALAEMEQLDKKILLGRCLRG